MIPQRDLSRIANGLLKPRGRRVPEAVIDEKWASDTKAYIKWKCQDA